MELRLPCGQCDGCRLEKARQWSVRCVHEASLYEENCFITLTYDDDHLPFGATLDYRDFQLFMKRLRKHFKSRTIRFFMCGEYGENRGRPHYHAALFNLDFNDKVYLKSTPAGSRIYTSETLSYLWSDRKGNSLGHASIGAVNFDSAGYIARYITKKTTRGSAHDEEYSFQDPETGEKRYRVKEFVHMSLKPGIGQGFYKKWKSDIYPHDYVVVNGKKTRPPEYYKKLLEKEDPFLYNQLQEIHCMASLEKLPDNTPQRLKDKETVLKAATKLLKRELS